MVKCFFDMAKLLHFRDLTKKMFTQFLACFLGIT